MMETERRLKQTTSAADAAVEGLLSGFTAGILMALSLIGLGMIAGDALATVLGNFDPGGGASPLIGGLAHLAVSGVYGIVFGLGWNLIQRRLPTLPAWVGGLIYGLVLFGLAQALLLPGAGSSLQEIPTVHFALAHVVYGLSLGLLMGRRSPATPARYGSR